MSGSWSFNNFVPTCAVIINRNWSFTIPECCSAIPNEIESGTENHFMNAKGRVEDYLIAIDRLCEQTGCELARSGQIAKVLGVTHGMVSTKLVRLADGGLIIYQPYEGAKLTELGRTRSRRVIRRLRIIELFLVTFAGWERESVVDEGRRLETVISDKVVDALNSFLGFPESHAS